MIQATFSTSVDRAKAGGLRYIDCFDAGIVRCKCGRGFPYKAADGSVVTSPSIKRRIASLVIPPAWKEVWICKDPRGHIQALGYDELGRKQYIYHPRWHEISSLAKFERMLLMSEVLPRIRDRVRRDLNSTKLTRDRVLAAIVRVIDKSQIRIGNEQYARERDTRGATTLAPDHVHVDGFTVSLDFPGKSGKRNEVQFTDRKVAKVIQQCEEVEGRYLFSYFDEKEKVCHATSSDVNQYLTELAGQPLTAKDFRTWWASVVALESLSEVADQELSLTASRRAVVAAVRTCSELLGNTMAVCRKSYIHPQIIESFEYGSLAEELRQAKRYVKAKSDMKQSESQFEAWLKVVSA